MPERFSLHSISRSSVAFSSTSLRRRQAPLTGLHLMFLLDACVHNANAQQCCQPQQKQGQIHAGQASRMSAVQSLTHNTSSSCQLMEFASTLFGVDCTWPERHHQRETMRDAGTHTYRREGHALQRTLTFFAAPRISTASQQGCQYGYHRMLHAEHGRKEAAAHPSQSPQRNWGPRPPATSAVSI